jgi:hypothetical protein
MPVRRCDDTPQRHTCRVDQQRTFRAELGAVDRGLPGRLTPAGRLDHVQVVEALADAALAGRGEPVIALDDQERMLDLGAHTRLA